MDQYGVKVHNKFAFLSGDEDSEDGGSLPLATVKEVKQQQQAPAQVKKVAPTIQERPPIANSVNKENIGQTRRADGGQPRAGSQRFNNREGGGRRLPVEAGEKLSDRFGENRGPPRNGENRGPPRRFRNQNAPRQPRFEGGGDASDEQNADVGQKPPRVSNGRFRRNGPGPRSAGGDRISGSDKTGVRSVPKKEGAGRGNWGAEGDELNASIPAEATGDESALAPSLVADADGVINIAAEDVTDSEKPPEPEPPREFTYEEWKAQHKPEQPQFNIRRPGDSADEKKLYKNLVPIRKAETEKKEEQKEEYVRKEPRERPLNIPVSFNERNRERGDRGGGGERGERRAGGFRGGDREERGGAGGYERRGGGDRRGGAAGGGGGVGGNYRRDGGGPSGGGRRNGPQTALDLTPESFPALGAAH